MGPSVYSDIGRKARDLLTKDYNFDRKFTLSVPSSTGMGLKATCVKKDQISVGDISTQYTSGNTTVVVKVDSYSNVSSKITLGKDLHGIKTRLSCNIFDHRTGKPSHCLLNVVVERSINFNTQQLRLRLRSGLISRHLPDCGHSHVRQLSNQAPKSYLDVHYRNHHATMNSSISLNHAPTLYLNASTGNKDMSFSGEVVFDISSSSFTKYNAGINFNNRDFSAALILMDKGRTLKASYFHKVSRSSAIAAEMTHRFSNHINRFTIGSSHVFDRITSMKTRFSNDGKLGMLYQREWRPKSLVTFSGEYNTKAMNSATKLGISLALKP